MFMRISSLVGLTVALASCSHAEAPTVAQGAEHVECALAGATRFAPDCAVERSQRAGIQVLTVRHPDGAFRRFDVLKDGRGMAASDGAEPAAIVLDGSMLAVSVGQDRYRFPVTLKGNGAKP